MISKDDIIFKFRKSYEMTYNDKYFCTVGGQTCIYDIESGKLLHSITGIKYASHIRFLDSDRLLIKNTIGEYRLFDVSKGAELLWKLPTLNRKDTQDSNFILSPDNKYMLDFILDFPFTKMAIIDIQTGKSEYIDFGNGKSSFAFYNESNQLFYIIVNHASQDGESPKVKLYTLKYPFDNNGPKYVKTICNHFIRAVDLKDQAVIYDHYKSPHYQKLDTGEDRIILEEYGHSRHLSLSKDGKLAGMVISKEDATKEAVIYDLEQDKVIKKYEVEYGCYIDFYKENQILLGSWKNGYLLKNPL